MVNNKFISYINMDVGLFLYTYFYEHAIFIKFGLTTGKFGTFHSWQVVYAIHGFITITIDLQNPKKLVAVGYV